MSYIKIMVHCVWRTKNNRPVLAKEKREQLQVHIRETAKTKDIFIDAIGGHTDHLHCLISLGGKQSIATVMQHIKGESSYWANKTNLLANKLEWAEDYFAASVSEPAIGKVREYIKKQEEHHRKMSFAEEYERFITSYGFKLG